VKIVYYTAGDRSFASSRLRAWMVGDALAEMGHQITFNVDPNWPFADVHIFQKRFDLSNMMEGLSKAGRCIVWDCDDYIADGPVIWADIVTVDTSVKQTLYPDAVVVPDVLDVPDGAIIKMEHSDDLNRVVWFGNADNLYHAANAAEACEHLGLCFVVITQLDKVTGEQRGMASEWHEWDLSTIDGLLIQCDLAACSYMADGPGPWPQAWVNSKSANRLLKAWGLGMPVVGTPIPSYVEAGLAHQATTIDEWIRELEMMRICGVRMGDAIRGVNVASAYRADIVAGQWLEVFETCIQ
jgi:hypothetical protein